MGGYYSYDNKNPNEALHDGVLKGDKNFIPHNPTYKEVYIGIKGEEEENELTIKFH